MPATVITFWNVSIIQATWIPVGMACLLAIALRWWQIDRCWWRTRCVAIIVCIRHTRINRQIIERRRIVTRNLFWKNTRKRYGNFCNIWFDGNPIKQIQWHTIATSYDWQRRRRLHRHRHHPHCDRKFCVNNTRMPTVELNDVRLFCRIHSMNETAKYILFIFIWIFSLQKSLSATHSGRFVDSVRHTISWCVGVCVCVFVSLKQIFRFSLSIQRFPRARHHDRQCYRPTKTKWTNRC